MESIRVLVARIFGAERRKQQEPIHNERRKQPRRTMKQADDRLRESLEEFSRTIIGSRNRNGDGSKFDSANDVQQVVIFRTLSEICHYRNGLLSGKRLCRHPTRGEMAFCDERSCPIVSKGAVAA